MKNRLPDPSEICALEFKGEFRRFEICPISGTIDIDRSILGVSRGNELGQLDREKTVSGDSRGGYAKRTRHTSCGSRVHGLHGLHRFAMLAAIGSRLLTIAAQIRRAPMPIGRLGTIEENPAALVRCAGLQARESIRLGQAIHFCQDATKRAGT